MKKSKFFLALGTVVLFGAAAFTVRAKRKYGGINIAYMHGVAGVYFQSLTEFPFTTINDGSFNLVHAYLISGGAMKLGGTLITSPNGSPIYYR